MIGKTSFLKIEFVSCEFLCWIFLLNSVENTSEKSVSISTVCIRFDG